MRADDDVLFFVHTWADAVLRQLKRVRELRERSAINFRWAEHAGAEESAGAEEILQEDFREW
jgi:hypothetical protein